MKNFEQILKANDLYHLHIIFKQKGITSLTDLELEQIDTFNNLNYVEKNKLKQLILNFRKSKLDSEKIIVCVRKRFVSDSEDDAIQIFENKITVNEPKLKVDLQPYTEKHQFEFDFSFDKHTTNDMLYESALTTVIKHVKNGGCGSMIAYGQTGTGKTYTMMEENTGIIFRALKDIMEVKKIGFIVFCEIYLGNIFDLIKNREKIQLREVSGVVHLTNSYAIKAENYDEACKIIMKGLSQRRTGVTGANRKSSRSHSICIINFDKKPTSAINSSNSLIFVDLAGSERGMDRRETSVETKNEGAEINKSLLALKECIRGIEQDKKHLPFRQSKLTLILKNSLIGESKTCIIATISPSYDNIEHTLNTLRYASRIKDFKKIEELKSSTEHSSSIFIDSSDSNSSFSLGNSSFFNQKFILSPNFKPKTFELIEYKSEIRNFIKKIENNLENNNIEKLKSVHSKLKEISKLFDNK